jgi:hypothetical protein
MKINIRRGKGQKDKEREGAGVEVTFTGMEPQNSTGVGKSG